MKFHDIKIEGFEHYSISGNGKVKNKNTDTLLKPFKIGSSKHLYISLYSKNKVKPFCISKLLLRTLNIIPDIDSIKESNIRITYKDGNSKNICVKNIEYSIIEDSHITGKVKAIPCYLHNYIDNTTIEFKSVYDLSKYYTNNINKARNDISIIKNWFNRLMDDKYIMSYNKDRISDIELLKLRSDSVITLSEYNKDTEIFQCDIDGNILRLFPNMETIKKVMSITDPSHVYKSLNDVREIGYGYKWIYTKEYFTKIIKSRKYDNKHKGLANYYLFDRNLNLLEEYNGQLKDLSLRFNKNINTIKTSIYSGVRLKGIASDVAYISKHKDVQFTEHIHIYDRFGVYTKEKEICTKIIPKTNFFYKNGSEYIANYKCSLLPIKKIGRFNDEGELIEILDTERFEDLLHDKGTLLYRKCGSKNLLKLKELENYRILRISDYPEYYSKKK